MQLPKFDIQIATDSFNSRILYNGEDISDAIRAVTVHQTAGELPIVTLQLAVGSKGASVRAQCEAILKLQDQ